MSVTVKLPWPPATLNPNRARNEHWRVIAAAKAAYRETAGWLAKEAVDQLTEKDLEDLHIKPVLARVTFFLPDRRRRDEDNLRAMLKSAWDGFQDAGLIVGDHVGVFRVESRVDLDIGRGEVVVVLTT